jgi:amino acid adenylation domain-containing protein
MSAEFRSALLQRIARLSPEQRAALDKLLAKQASAEMGSRTASRTASESAKTAGWPAPPDKFAVPRRAQNGPPPLSFAQRRLWFLDQLVGANPFYNQLAVMRLRFALDCSIMERAVREIIRRHESLRTRFASNDGMPVQVVEQDFPFKLEVIDLRGVLAARRDKHTAEVASTESAQPFDLSVLPLFRIKVLCYDDADHVLILVLHHIVADGWSSNLINEELDHFYRAYSLGLSPSLPRLSIQYSDYAAWQREQLASTEFEHHLTYWREQLKALPILRLPTDRTRSSAPSFKGGACKLTIPVESVHRLAGLVRCEKATLFIGLLAAFAGLLHRYCRQDVVVIGTPVAGRDRPELEGLIGIFVNSLVLRCDCSGNPSFLELLRRMREVALGAYAHQQVPFERLVEELQPARDTHRNPLFQVTIQLQSTGSATTSELGVSGAKELGGRIVSEIKGTAVFDLAFNLWHGPDGIAGFVEYSRDLFDDGTIARMVEHYINLVDSASRNPDTLLSELQLLSEGERHKLIVEWNDTRKPYASDSTVHQMVARQAYCTPNATAIVCGDDRLSYSQLNGHADALAARLRAHGIGRGSLIAVYLQRSPQLIVGLLAVLKAGAAYVPVDPTYPSARIEFILRDCKAIAVLTTPDLRSALSTVDVGAVQIFEVQCWEAPSDELWKDKSDIGHDSTANDPAYVIYTSGSTGDPKGAVISHRSMVNYLQWCLDAYLRDSGRGAPVQSSISFDLTVTSLFSPLLAGREVHLIAEPADVTMLGLYLAQCDGFSLIKITPAHLRLLAQQISPAHAANLTRAFVIGGEQLTAADVAFWRAHAPGTVLINEYGPTEAVVGCCTYRISDEEPVPDQIPIGRPINNVCLYVLDEHQQVVPIGIPGELFIGGDGVALGYLNRPELTETKFVPDPFAPSGGRMYRTGDMARWRSDGNLEFLGRIDDQVKVKGYRVELGEVEAALFACPVLKEAAVTVEADSIGQNRLVAYVVAADDTPEGEDSFVTRIRELLGRRLPTYMVPSLFVLVDTLPLTSNGKIDRQSLPCAISHKAYHEPQPRERTATENRLVDIWSKLLQLTGVGVDQNFFTELGGHSLLAFQMIYRVRQEFEVELPLRTVFERPTIAEFATALDELQGETSAALLPIRKLPRRRA